MGETANFFRPGLWAILLSAPFFSIQLTHAETTGQGILDPAKRIPFRFENPAVCAKFLVPNDAPAGALQRNGKPKVKLNASVGVPLGSTMTELRNQLQLILKDHGETPLLRSRLYVTGFEMRHEKQVIAETEKMLAELKLDHLGIKVIVLSIPTQEFKALSTQIFRVALEKIIYLLPNIRRDYVAPLPSEVAAGLATSVAIEAFNVPYLIHVLPPVDAALTLTAHAATLAAYTVFSQSMVNWLLRNATQNRILALVEGFLKQLALSAPFTVNYNVFGNYSHIVQFYKDNGWDATLRQFPDQLAVFASTQGLTVMLQTFFYNVAITHGTRKWASSQQGLENNDDARVLTKYLEILPLALDALFLGQASSNLNPLMSIGPLQINMGHLELLALTAVSSIVYFRPGVLDFTLPLYQKLKDRFKAVVGTLNRLVRTGAFSTPGG